MFSYENGLVVAFLLWLYQAILLIVSINSQLEKNLRRIGQRLSWLTLRPKPMEHEDLNRSVWANIWKYLLVIGIGLPAIVLSWLNVAWYIGAFIFWRVKDSGAPQAVREFRWKMRNANLSFDQMIKELMKVADEDPSKFDTFRANYISDMQARGLPFNS